MNVLWAWIGHGGWQGKDARVKIWVSPPAVGEVRAWSTKNRVLTLLLGAGRTGMATQPQAVPPLFSLAGTITEFLNRFSCAPLKDDDDFVFFSLSGRSYALSFQLNITWWRKCMCSIVWQAPARSHQTHTEIADIQLKFYHKIPDVDRNIFLLSPVCNCRAGILRWEGWIDSRALNWLLCIATFSLAEKVLKKVFSKAVFKSPDGNDLLRELSNVTVYDTPLYKAVSCGSLLVLRAS